MTALPCDWHGKLRAGDSQAPFQGLVLLLLTVLNEEGNLIVLVFFCYFFANKHVPELNGNQSERPRKAVSCLTPCACGRRTLRAPQLPRGPQEERRGLRPPTPGRALLSLVGAAPWKVWLM